MNMKALSYIRVSTDQQAEDGYGLEIQREHIQSYCKENNIELIETYCDEGISGSKLFERKALMSLIDHLESEPIDYLIVAKIDRLYRNHEARGWIKYELQRRGIKTKILSLVQSENREGEDAISRMMDSIIAYIAEAERERITQRLSDGRSHKRSKGGYIGGQAPLGYYSEEGTKRLHIDQDKVKTVHRIFELKDSGSLATIADKLNTEGYTTRDGKRFNAMQIKRVYDREKLYRGEMEAPAIL